MFARARMRLRVCFSLLSLGSRTLLSPPGPDREFGRGTGPGPRRAAAATGRSSQQHRPARRVKVTGNVTGTVTGTVTGAVTGTVTRALRCLFPAARATARAVCRQNFLCAAAAPHQREKVGERE